MKTTLVHVTPDMAKTWIEADTFSLQRSLKGGHINALANAMKDGEFPAGTQLCFAITPAGRVFIDGQHRLRAQIIAGIDVDYAMLEVECQDDAAVRTLYSRLDIGAKRSLSDRMRSLDTAGQLGLPVRQAQLLGMAAPYIKFHFGKFSGMQAYQMTPVQRLEILRPYAEAARRYFATIEAGEPWLVKILSRPHLVAFGVYTYQYGGDRAHALWSSLAINDTGDLDDPRKFLINLAMSVNSKTIALKKTLATVQAFIRGWNAYVENRPLKQKPTTNSTIAETVRILAVSDPQPEAQTTRRQVTTTRHSAPAQQISSPA